MATQDELDWDNTVSRNRQRETREFRAQEKAVDDRRKQLLQGASSTKDRRDIKAGVYDLDTQPREDNNKQGTDERIQNDGIDRIGSPVEEEGGGGGGGGLPDGINENDTLYWDGSDWVILSAPSASGTWVLGVVDGAIEWIGTDTCP